LNATLGPTENSVPDRPSPDSYVAKTNPADHPSPLDPAADTSKTIGYADVTNLNIPSGTKSLLLELYSPRTFGVALSEIQAFPAVSIDYGDALASYGAPCHSITSQLYLGTVPPDGESGLQDTANAQGDDLNNTLIYMAVDLASSQFVADQAGWKSALRKFFLKNQ